MLDLLLRLGANANERAEDKKTALHLASEFGHLRVVQALLKHACDTLAVDSVRSICLSRKQERTCNLENIERARLRARKRQ